MAGEIFIAKEETLQSVLMAVNGLVTKADSIGTAVDSIVTAVDTANTNISTANGKLDNMPTNDTIGNYVGSSGVVKSKQIFKYSYSSMSNWGTSLWLGHMYRYLTIPISTVDISKCIIDIKANISSGGGKISTSSSISTDYQFASSPVLKDVSNTSITVAMQLNQVSKYSSSATMTRYVDVGYFTVEVIEFY